MSGPADAPRPRRRVALTRLSSVGGSRSRPQATNCASRLPSQLEDLIWPFGGRYDGATVREDPVEEPAPSLDSCKDKLYVQAWGRLGWVPLMSQ